MRMIARIGNWFDQRLQLSGPVFEMMQHPVPSRTASWAYVFGSAAMTAFGLQIVTGVLLALIYVPSAGEAWSSLQSLNHQVALGWFIRALHGWGSNFMLAIVLIHMGQVFLFGAYKYPRELTWIVGVFLLLVTLGMAFTGQVLRFDQDAYWGLGIGASIASRVPVMGPVLVKLMLGGPIIAGATLSRFFALHVFVIPGLLIGFIAVHVLLVLKLGVNEWPMPGRVVRRDTYLREYHRTPSGRTSRSPGSSCWRLSAVPISSGHSVPAGSPIPRSFRRRRNRTSSFSGCTRSCRSFLPRPRRRSC
jgi:ubiquinol-cytochrome c reductase cytochrome b subunit